MTFKSYFEEMSKITNNNLGTILNMCFQWSKVIFSSNKTYMYSVNHVNFQAILGGLKTMEATIEETMEETIGEIFKTS